MDGVVITQRTVDERDSFGQYALLPNHIHVFEFTVPMFGSITIGHAHILPNSQDFSIDYWISEEPLDQRRFSHVKLIRRKVETTYHCSFLKANEDDNRYFLQSGRTYYVNVKNLQNSRNAYELTFSSPNI